MASMRFLRALWVVWAEDLGDPVGQLSGAAQRYAAAIRDGDEGWAAVHWGDVMLRAAAVQRAWEPWLRPGLDGSRFAPE